MLIFRQLKRNFVPFTIALTAIGSFLGVSTEPADARGGMRGGAVLATPAARGSYFIRARPRFRGAGLFNGRTTRFQARRSKYLRTRGIRPKRRRFIAHRGGKRFINGQGRKRFLTNVKRSSFFIRTGKGAYMTHGAGFRHDRRFLHNHRRKGHDFYGTYYPAVPPALSLDNSRYLNEAPTDSRFLTSTRY